jgi:hypothetical protein
MIQTDNEFLLVDYVQRFFAELGPTVMKMKVLKKQTAVVSCIRGYASRTGLNNFCTNPFFDMRVILTVNGGGKMRK